MKTFFHILLHSLLCYSTMEEPISASIYYIKTSGRFVVKENIIDTKAVATASFYKEYEQDGWDKVHVASYQGDDKKYPDWVKAYGMGYLEGVLTYERIYNFYLTMVKYKFHSSESYSMPERTRQFLIENLSYMKYHSAELRKSDPYWDQVFNIYKQLEGMVDGYNSKVEKNKQISSIDFQILAAMSDLDELNYWNNPSAIPKFSEMTAKEIEDFVSLSTHCSSLIKLEPEYKDIWFGHNTWSGYNEMARMFKEYKFKTNINAEKSKTVAFSSYAGAISSTDDFFLMDNDLFVMETTNSIFNETLYSVLTPKSLLTWIRVVLANRLSSNGEEWVENFARENSGTCNNQWQVLDLNKIDLENKKINPGALWILEQLPGDYESKDMTDTLKSQTYWPSYNCAYFDRVRKIANYEEKIANNTELEHTLDYKKAARGQIFAREQSTVNSVDTFKKIIRYNDYQNDELSLKNPVYTIASRYDLRENKTENICFGNVDAKFGALSEIKGKPEKLIHIINGPTNQEQPTFSWKNTTCINTNPKRWDYTGQVETYNFKWVDYSTKQFGN